jgi:predicted PurR-regulated permease PerM
VKAIVGSVAKVTSRFGISSEDLTARVQAVAEGAVSHAGALAEMVASTAAEGLLVWFFSAVTMYTLMTHKEDIRATVEGALPLRLDYTRKLIAELRDVGRQTLVGTVGTGLLQGILGTIGYWIAGVPRPLFFGAATAVATLVPGLGTMLVWVPAGIALIVLGHVGHGIFLLAWGVVIVTSLISYVVRPRLLGRGGSLPTLAMFAALFGGAATMGVKGLIVAPVLMSVAFAILKLYWDDARQHSPATG